MAFDHHNLMRAKEKQTLAHNAKSLIKLQAELILSEERNMTSLFLSTVCPSPCMYLVNYVLVSAVKVKDFTNRSQEILFFLIKILILRCQYSTVTAK